MKRLNQKERVLVILERFYGRWVDFRYFWYKGIAEPGTRISDLRINHHHNIPNDYIFNKKTGQKCSYYSLNPVESLEQAIEHKKTIESKFY